MIEIIDDKWHSYSTNEVDRMMMIVESEYKDGDDSILPDFKRQLSKAHLGWTTDKNGKRVRRWMSEHEIKPDHPHPSDEHALAYAAFNSKRKNVSKAKARDFIERHFGKDIADYILDYHEKKVNTKGAKLLEDLVSGKNVRLDPDSVALMKAESERGVRRYIAKMKRSRSIGVQNLGMYYEEELNKSTVVSAKSRSDLMSYHAKMRDIVSRQSRMMEALALRPNKGESRGALIRRRFALFQGESGTINRAELLSLVSADRSADIGIVVAGENLSTGLEDKANQARLFLSMMCDKRAVDSSRFLMTEDLSDTKKPPHTSTTSPPSIAMTGLKTKKDEVLYSSAVSVHCHELAHCVELTVPSIYVGINKMRREACEVEDGKFRFVSNGKREMLIRKKGLSLGDDYSYRMYSEDKSVLVDSPTEVLSSFIEKLYSNPIEVISNRWLFDGVIGLIQR